MTFHSVISSIFNNLIRAGLLVAISLTILEKISKNIKYVGFFSFISGSFFILMLFQYNKVSFNKLTLETFLTHSIIGGIIWCIYALIMYILFKLNYSSKQILTTTALIMISVSTFYYYFASNNFFQLFK